MNFYTDFDDRRGPRRPHQSGTPGNQAGSAWQKSFHSLRRRRNGTFLETVHRSVRMHFYMDFDDRHGPRRPHQSGTPGNQAGSAWQKSFHSLRRRRNGTFLETVHRSVRMHFYMDFDDRHGPRRPHQSGTPGNQAGSAWQKSFHSLRRRRNGTFLETVHRSVRMHFYMDFDDRHGPRRPHQSGTPGNQAGSAWQKSFHSLRRRRNGTFLETVHRSVRMHFYMDFDDRHGPRRPHQSGTPGNQAGSAWQKSFHSLRRRRNGTFLETVHRSVRMHFYMDFDDRHGPRRPHQSGTPGNQAGSAWQKSFHSLRRRRNGTFLETVHRSVRMHFYMDFDDRHGPRRPHQSGTPGNQAGSAWQKSFHSLRRRRNGTFLETVHRSVRMHFYMDFDDRHGPRRPHQSGTPGNQAGSAWQKSFHSLRRRRNGTFLETVHRSVRMHFYMDFDDRHGPRRPHQSGTPGNQAGSAWQKSFHSLRRRRNGTFLETVHRSVRMHFYMDFDDRHGPRRPHQSGTPGNQAGSAWQKSFHSLRRRRNGTFLETVHRSVRMHFYMDFDDRHGPRRPHQSGTPGNQAGSAWQKSFHSLRRRRIGTFLETGTTTIQDL